MVWILELFDTGFETGYVLPENLGSCLSSAVVVLAEIALLGTLTLLTGRLRAITSL